MKYRLHLSPLCPQSQASTLYSTISASRGTLPVHLRTTVHELGLWLNATRFTVYGRERGQPECYAPPDTPLAEVKTIFADLEPKPATIETDRNTVHVRAADVP